LLEECATQGKWLFFKNLHLVPAFLVTLEKTFKKLDKNKNFKLWLTSEEQNKFPTIFLESCFKVSYESPPGVKLNV
jgi:dynein heavy chain 2